MDYTKAVEIYKDIQARMRPLVEEYRQRMGEAYPSMEYSDPYGDTMLMFFPDVSSKDAHFDFENERSRFYTVVVDGVEISECVRKWTL